MDRLMEIFKWGDCKRTLQSPNVKYELVLKSKMYITSDTVLFRFALPSQKHTLGSPVGQHVYLSAKIGGHFVPRPYTPISIDTVQGYVDFVIKIYRRDENHPEGGILTQHLEGLRVGDLVQAQGPTGDFMYHGVGGFSIRPDQLSPFVKRNCRKFSMIAGGSGITPMLQLIRKMISEENDKSEARLIFANRTEHDILLRNELEEVEKKLPGRFGVWFTISKAPEGWTQGVGYITEEMLKEHIFAPGPDNMVLICGPPAMIDTGCVPLLEKLGYDQNNIFIY